MDVTGNKDCFLKTELNILQLKLPPQVSETGKCIRSAQCKAVASTNHCSTSTKKVLLWWDTDEVLFAYLPDPVTPYKSKMSREVSPKGLLLF